MTNVCPRCKSHLIKEVNESETLHVSKKRMHIYNCIRKGIKCLVCGYDNVRFGVK